MDQQPEFTPRIGTFLILVGIGLLLVFVGSYLAKSPHYSYLFGSLIVLVFGFLLRRRAKSRPSGRFRAVRGIYDKSRERQEQKREKKKQKK